MSYVVQLPPMKHNQTIASIFAKTNRYCIIRKGSLMHVAPACAVPREGSDHLGLMYAAFPCISAKVCF
jgi:hypothetical protein